MYQVLLASTRVVGKRVPATRRVPSINGYPRIRLRIGTITRPASATHRVLRVPAANEQGTREISSLTRLSWRLDEIPTRARDIGVAKFHPRGFPGGISINGVPGAQVPGGHEVLVVLVTRIGRSGILACTRVMGNRVPAPHKGYTP